MYTGQEQKQGYEMEDQRNYENIETGHHGFTRRIQIYPMKDVRHLPSKQKWPDKATSCWNLIM